jgi:hypothetical protein
LGSTLFGSQEYTGVSRALAELQARRPVQINAPGETLLILPVEGLDNRRLTEFVSLCRPERPHLIITQQRALALGLDASTAMAVRLPEAVDAGKIFNLVAERKSHSVPRVPLLRRPSNSSSCPTACPRCWPPA